MKVIKLIPRFLCWLAITVSIALTLQALRNLPSMNNWTSGIIYILICLVPTFICLWLANLRKDFKTIDQVKATYPKAREFNKMGICFLIALQIIGQLVCTLLLYKPFDELLTTYESAETFLLEKFEAEESTVDIMRLLPGQYAEYMLASAEVISDAIALDSTAEDYEAKSEELLVGFEKVQSGLILEGVIILAVACLTAYFYTLANLTSLYHQSIKYVKEKKRR